MATEQMRARAKELRAETQKLSLAVTTDENGVIDLTSVVAAIVAHNEANMLEALADAFEYQTRVAGSDSLRARRQQMMERADAIRSAASRGDWDEYNRLINTATNRSGSSGDPGGSGSQGGDAETPST